MSVREHYLKRLGELIHFDSIRKANLRIVYDALHGCGGGYLDRALSDHDIASHTIRANRDVLFDGTGPDVAESNLAPLLRALREHEANVGLATDGDADRFGVLDADGTWFQPNHILALLYDYLLETRGWAPSKGQALPAARSVATSHLMDAVARSYGTTVYQTPVGFKYIGELIGQDKIALGGEESAGLTIRGHVPEKDGILACLLVAEMIAARRATLSRTIARSVSARGRRILADANESAFAGRRAGAHGGAIERRLREFSRAASCARGSHRWIEIGIRGRLLGAAAAFGDGAAVAGVHGSGDAGSFAATRRADAGVDIRRSRGRKRSMMKQEAPSVFKRYGQPVLFVVFVLLFVHDIFGDHGFIAMRRTQREIEQMRGDISKLNDENRSLSGQVTALKSDPRMIERIARDEMGLARPGEMIFKVPADSADASSPGGGSSDKPQ